MRIRGLEPEDLELLYTIENDRSLWWVGAQTAPVSRFRLREYVASCEADIYKDEQVRFVIETETAAGLSTEAVGLIDLFNFSPCNRRAELGIAILQRAQGKGVAQEAIKEIITYARDIIGIHQIYAIVPSSNLASRKMLLNIGFRLSAVLKDWLLHGQKYEDALFMQRFLE
ncbi:MAG: GNAT family N-acetyltransferase [Bacteroidales bacterium]|nr:GNAT family N-acetyltransferase [Bacteroidales bacterium]MCM1148058.1 GNAT family N-acetyltransferase [Bacteroidales bacterium]MCM1207171.1 GNAT family N-acetyltransferase [Bacillota bacterium]MCM1509488.1 GNAT family N-acetyltransferase [Clostridium sp.]